MLKHFILAFQNRNIQILVQNQIKNRVKLTLSFICTGVPSALDEFEA